MKQHQEYIHNQSNQIQGLDDLSLSTSTISFDDNHCSRNVIDDLDEIYTHRKHKQCINLTYLTLLSMTFGVIFWMCYWLTYEYCQELLSREIDSYICKSVFIFEILTCLSLSLTPFFFILMIIYWFIFSCQNPIDKIRNNFIGFRLEGKQWENQLDYYFNNKIHCLKYYSYKKTYKKLLHRNFGYIILSSYGIIFDELFLLTSNKNIFLNGILTDNKHNHHSQRQRTTMRSLTVNNNHQSSNEINLNLNEFNINNTLIEYSISELQEMTIHQQEQIKKNQQLLFSREQRLKYFNQQQTTQEIFHFTNIKHQEIKNFRLKQLQNQINQQKYSNPTFENEFEILKEIYLNKENELKILLNKLNELTKQFEQLKILNISTNNEQLQNKIQLEKLKQELIIRNNLNEQQSHKIIYQRQLFQSKQTELNQLNNQIEEYKKTKISQSSNDFRTALNSVQDTLNNINIAEIEKHMLQLANSFNLIHENQNNHLNSPKKVNGGSSKIAFASKSEIAATYMAPSPTINLPIIENKSIIDEELLPGNLRLNDDILSVHYNNITSNVKKRHSLSDSTDLLTKYLTPNIEQQQQEEPIQVRDESLSETKSIIITCENFLDDDNDEQQQETIIESFISDTESEGSISEDIESITLNSFSTTSITNLKSLLKTSATPKNTSRRVIFDPLALLLDAAVLGEIDLVIKSAKEVKNPSQPNDEGLTALHNAVCASNFDCVKFLVEFGCDINYADNDGWTPLHCAASCNNTLLVKFLIEHGACIYATTIRDNETAIDKCEEEEENYITCSQYLLNVQNELGVINNGLVYGLYDYDPNPLEDNELEFKDGDRLIILKRGDEYESEWWWAKHENTEKEGYIPRNYLGLYPRIRPNSIPSINC